MLSGKRCVEEVTQWQDHTVGEMMGTWGLGTEAEEVRLGLGIR
jgi:hypothetical protein